MATTTVVPDSTIPGSPAWVQAVVENARRFAGIVEHDVRPLIREYRELIEHESWTVALVDEPKTKERFCKEVLGYSVEFLDTLDRGVRILDELGHHGAVAKTDAVRIAEAQDQLSRQEAGSNQHISKRADGSKLVNNIHKQRPAGTSQKAGLRRLRKDRPDLLERVLNGELSTHAAEIEAGHRKPTTTIRTDDVAKALATLFRFFTADELIEALEALR